MTTLPNILAVGGAHIDRRGQVSTAYVPAASNPGVMHEDIGGGVFNALRNAMRFGASASLFSLKGGDIAGDAVSRAIEAAGISDLSAVFLDRSTPSYTAILDQHGELLVGFADMALYDIGFPKQMRRANVRNAAMAADAIMCDANLPFAALEKLTALAGGKPVFAIAISPAKVVRLSRVLHQFAVVFMNQREALALAADGSNATIAETVASLRQKGLKAGVITSGDGPVTGFDEQSIFSVVPPIPRHIADVTGAGDALAGTTVAALLKGLQLHDAVLEGAAAAMLTIESSDAVADFSAESFAVALSFVHCAQEMI